MDQNMLEKVQSVDLSVLTEIVRQDQHSPDFEILDWSVRPFTTKGVLNSDGLFLYEGRGRDALGEMVWRVVAKTFHAGPNLPPMDNFWYPKREMHVFGSDLFRHLPGPVHSPHCYGIDETTEDGMIWMEFVADSSPDRWTLDQFAYAARQVGRWNARCFYNQAMLKKPWLCHDHMRGWLEGANTIPGWKDYSHPFIRKMISKQSFARALQLYDEREYWFDLLTRLPQVFSHNDLHRRNLMIRKLGDGQNELVAIDWALTGISALGGELHSLIGMNAMLFEVDMSQLETLENVAYDAYLAGLRDEAWNENPDLVRLAYTVWTALSWGAAGPALILTWLSEDWQSRSWPLFNCGAEDVIVGLAQLCEFSLDRADEARRLIDRLKL